MEWTVQMDPSGRFVRVVADGGYTVQDHLQMTEDVLTQSFWVPGFHVLFDHRNLDMSDVDYESMRAAALNHVQNDDRIGAGKAAILVGSDRDFGSARQFQLLAEPKVMAVLRAFKDEEEAVEWLTE